jgi:predicted metalloprotease with PDZ domain
MKIDELLKEYIKRLKQRQAILIDSYHMFQRQKNAKFQDRILNRTEELTFILFDLETMLEIDKKNGTLKDLDNIYNDLFGIEDSVEDKITNEEFQEVIENLMGEKKHDTQNEQ